MATPVPDRSRDAARGLENYQIFSGQHPQDQPDGNTYDIQTRKGNGRWKTTHTFERRAQAGAHYSSINVGEGFSKRIRVNGKVTHTTHG